MRVAVPLRHLACARFYRCATPDLREAGRETVPDEPVSAEARNTVTDGALAVVR